MKSTRDGTDAVCMEIETIPLVLQWISSRGIKVESAALQVSVLGTLLFSI